MKYSITSIFIFLNAVASAVTFRFESTALQNIKVMIAAPGNTYFVLNEFNGSQLSYLDTGLNLVWQKTLSTGGINSMSRCMNGDLLFTGRSGNDVFAFRTDSLGNTIWNHSYSHFPYWSSGTKIIEHSTGNIFIIGTALDYFGIDSNYVMLFIKLDPLGSLIWEKENGTLHPSYGLDLAESASGKLLVELKQFSLNGNHGETHLYDDQGTGYWWTWISVSIFGFIAGEPEVVRPTDNGGCIAFVRVPTPNATPAFILHSIIGTGGSTGIEMQYELPDTQGGTYDIKNVSIVQTTDKGFALTGSVNIPGYNHVLLKVDSTLVPQWCRIYPSNLQSISCSIFQTSDNGFLIAKNDSGKMILWKTDSFGNAFCGDSSVLMNYALISNAGANSNIFSFSMNPAFNTINYPVTNTLGATSNWDTLCYNINTSIDESENESILIYPNPSSDKFTIEFNHLNARLIEIYNMFGERIIIKKLEDTNSAKVSCKGLTAGIYIVTITFSDGNISTSKIEILR